MFERKATQDQLDVIVGQRDAALIQVAELIDQRHARDMTIEDLQGQLAAATHVDEVTADNIDELLVKLEHDTDMQAITQVLQAEVAELAKAKIALRLHPAGGIKEDTRQLERQITMHSARIETLKHLRVIVADGNPIPLSTLEVARSLPTDGSDGA